MPPTEGDTWLLVAGERSSDQVGAALMRAMRSCRPIQLWVCGGQEMAKEADRFLGYTVDVTSVGVIELWRGRGPMRQLLQHVEKTIQLGGISRAIILDFPHYHHQFAMVFQRQGIPIDTVITPHFWMWNDQKRGRKLMAYSDRIVTIFERETQWYTQLGASPLYGGYPLLDAHTPLPPRPVWNASRQGRHIGLFPGSRPNEIRRLLPPALGIIRRMPEWVYHVVVPSEHEALAQAIMAQQGVRVGPGSPVRSLGPEWQSLALDAAVVATGTMSVELILHRIPIVVMGALHPVSYAIAKWVLRLPLPWIGLPNILAGRHWVPELRQGGVTPPRLARAVSELLDPKAWEALQDAYDGFIAGLGTPPIVPQIAKVLLTHGE